MVLMEAVVYGLGLKRWTQLELGGIRVQCILTELTEKWLEGAGVIGHLIWLKQDTKECAGYTTRKVGWDQIRWVLMALTAVKTLTVGIRVWGRQTPLLPPGADILARRKGVFRKPAGWRAWSLAGAHYEASTVLVVFCITCQILQGRLSHTIWVRRLKLGEAGKLTKSILLSEEESIPWFSDTKAHIVLPQDKWEREEKEREEGKRREGSGGEGGG